MHGQKSFTIFVLEILLKCQVTNWWLKNLLMWSNKEADFFPEINKSFTFPGMGLRLYMPPNFTCALRKGAVSSGTFVLAPFLTICFFFYKLHWISTRLGQNHQWVKGYKSYQQFDLKGQVGVTGVKNVKKFCFYGKCYSSFTLHSRVTWLRYINKLETPYKTYWLKSRFWVIWGHRGQKFIFTKNASPHTICIVWSRDLCI